MTMLRLLSATVVLLAPLAMAAPDRVAIAPDLTRTPIELVSIDANGVGVADETGIVRTPLARIAAILPIEGEVAWRSEPVLLGGGLASGGGSWVIELVDGQRLFGKPAASDDPDTVLWTELPGLPGTRLEIPLERVRMIASDVAAKPRATEVDDRIRTRNGDELAGFVASIGATIEFESELGPTTLSREQIERVELANPAMAATAPLVWLVDGTVLGVGRLLETSRDRIAFQLEIAAGRGPRVDVELADVAAIELAPGRIVPLASLAPFEASPAGSRRWTPPPRALDHAMPLGLHDVLLPGPMEIRVALPEGVSRFSTEAWLVDGSPWSGTTLVVALDQASREVARADLSLARSRAVVDVEIPEGARTLVLRLEPGARGAIRDRVILRQPMLAATPR